MDVSLRGLGKTYDGEAWAVRNMSFEVPKGSIFGLIGPNGAGKSTTLRMIATAMPATEGEISFDGGKALREGEELELRRRIGFLGDGNPLYKAMTAAEYLRFFGQCYQIEPKRLDKAVDEVLTVFRLNDKRDAQCGALSKGMRQRVLIARCLLHKPELLILDEPADGLDPKGRHELRQIIKQIREDGVTVIVSSHILRELDDLCDEVAILQRGSVVVSGAVDDIISKYEVERFVYRMRLLGGIEQARSVLAQHRVLIEEESTEDGLACIAFQLQRDESVMPAIISDLVSAGVSLVTVSRDKSRLEDVYNRISEDRVN